MLSITGIRLDASLVRTLLARRDISVTITCVINGNLYTIIIPAGAEISNLVAADGTVDIEKLADTFSKKEVR